MEEWDWPEEEGPPAWAWEQVQRYLWLASRLAPFDAQILSDLGQLYERRVVKRRRPNPARTSNTHSGIIGKRSYCARPGPMPGPISRCSK